MTSPPGPGKGRLGILRDHDFRGLFLSTTVSQFGQQVTMLALPLIAVLALDVDEFEVGLLTAMTTVAFLLIGLPAGAWVDRMRCRNVLITSDLVRATVLITVPIAWWSDVLTIWQLYAVAFITGVFTVFFDIAYQSYLPFLIGRKNLAEGNAKLETVHSTAQLGGPAMAGQLISWLTAPLALLIDAIAMAASALFVTRIRRREPKPKVAAEAKLIAEIKEGLQYVFTNRLLKSIAATTGLFNLVFAAYMTMLIVFLPRDIGIGPGLIGLVLSLFGVGGLLGALISQRMTAWLGEGRIIWISVAVTTPFALLFPIAEPGWRLWVGTAGITIVGFGVVLYNVAQVSFRQRLTPDHLLGRMNATIRFMTWGTQPIGAVLGGFVGQFFGARNALWIFAIAACLTFLPVFLSPLRNMRVLPHSDLAESEKLPVKLLRGLSLVTIFPR